RAYVPVVAKALSKNPAHRYASMAEMARAVEEVGMNFGRAAEKKAECKERPAEAVPARRAREVLPEVLPATSPRGAVGELCGSMALTTLIAGLGSAVWAALHWTSNQNISWTEPGAIFLTTVMACWAVLLPSKVWGSRKGDSWVRRLVLLVMGLAV